MANVTYTVKKGDTLSQIAANNNTTVSKLVSLNNITDPDYIVVGQTIIISGTAATKSSNNSNRAKILQFGLQSDTDRTVYATWSWDKDKTENYDVKWMYATGDGVGFVGSRTTVNEQQSLYNAPQNATHVAFYVKPISKTHEVNKKDTHYWTADWSLVERYYFKDNPPSKPAVPDVEIKDYTLTATLDNLDVNGNKIEFQVYKDNSKLVATGLADIKTTHVTYTCSVEAGSEYKVRCRAVRGELHSDWTEFSENQGTAPAATTILELRATKVTNVAYLDWKKISTAETYEVEYVDRKSRFDSSNEPQTLTITAPTSHAEVSVDVGKEWFFRVRAINSNGNSPWSEIKSVKIGTKPIAPTTWSATATVTVGNNITMYWVHNTEDGSSETQAELEVNINGSTTIYRITKSTDEDEKDKTSFYTLSTSGYSEGAKVKWRVRTKGILDEYSDWSIQRTIDIYAPPTLAVNITDNSGSLISTVSSFPFNVVCTAGPTTQAPIGYHITVASNSIYETIDNMGNNITINNGEVIFSEYFDISDSNFTFQFNAGNINLENNVSYTIVCSVAMNSGLTAESTSIITVGWTDEDCSPNAEVSYNNETYTTSIMPFCEDISGSLVSNVTLSVYRREFDGSFTELITGVINDKSTFITDPHPSLDYARYRIVATSTTTGSVSYYDMPGYPIGETSIIIQWDEDWSTFNVVEEEPNGETGEVEVNGNLLEQPPWSGSLLKLPYNIDVSDQNDTDVDLIKYIGRKRPVSYYGTQLGETSTWNAEIPKDDKDTLYALRRLAIWMGDVYVREPSGSGYWANITVSFNQKHLNLTIPVSLSITRVDGGV